MIVATVDNLFFVKQIANRVYLPDCSQQEMPQVEIEEEVKADNINDAIKSVIKKSQANDGRYRRLPL